MPNGQPKNFKENKKDLGNHSGINMAGGGLGNRNPITGGKKCKSIIKFDENVPYGDNGYDVMFVNPTDATVDGLT